MRLALAAGFLSFVLAGSAGATLTPGEFSHRDALDACAGPIAALDCSAEAGDEATVAAELLYATMGTAAIGFAFQRAAQLAADNEPEAAELWRRIAIAAAELAARRPPLDPVRAPPSGR